MRLATEIRVQALVRRCSAGGGAAFVVRRGDSERGALYVKVSTLDGRARLLGPAPPSFDDARDDRPMTAHLAPAGAPEAEIDAYMVRQTEYDPDLWLVEIEDRAGRDFLEE